MLAVLALYVSYVPLHISTGGPNRHSEGLLNQHCLHIHACSLPKVRYFEILIGLRMLTKLHLAKLIDFLLLLHKLKMSILLDARNIIVTRCPLSCPQDTKHITLRHTKLSVIGRMSKEFLGSSYTQRSKVYQNSYV